METTIGSVAVQLPHSWHEGGLFMGMHWLWWAVWAFTLAVLSWAFVRLFAERSRVRREVTGEEAAEETLRRRFAAGEIDEDEFSRRMRILRDTPVGG